MNNGKTEAIDLLIDTSAVNECLANVGSMLDSLKEAAINAGAAISDAFSPVLGVFDQVGSGVRNVGSVLSGVGNNVGEVEKVSKSLFKYVDAINNASTTQGGILAGIFPETAKLITSVDNLFGTVKNGFAKSIKGIGSIFSGASLGWGAVIAAVIAGIILIIQNWDTIKAAIGTAAEWLNTTVIQPVIGFFTNLWSGITNIVARIWNGIVAVCSGVGQWIYDNVITPVMNIFAPIIEWYATLFGAVWQTVSDVFYNIGVIITGCWDVICVVWQIVADWFNTNVIQPIASFFSGLWTSVTTFVTDAWTGIQAVLSTIGTWIDTNVIQPVAEFFSGLWEGFSSAALDAWKAVKSVFGAVTGFFEQIFSNAWAKVVAVFDVAGDIFVNIKDGILSAFKTIVNGIIGGLNKAIAVPFNGINKAIEMIRGIEIVGLTPFSGLKTFSVPQIPLLAQGAVLPANRPFLAMVGDQKHGTNVEAPLATIQEALANVLAQQGMGGDIHITFTGDLAQLGWGDLSVLGSIGWRKPGFPKADS